MPLRPPSNPTTTLLTETDLDTRIDSIIETFGINPTDAEYGADPTGVTDSTTGFRLARAAALVLNVPVIIPPGTYKVSAYIHDAAVTSTAVKFVAAVPGTVTIQRTADVSIISVLGTRGTQVALTANVAAGDRTVTTATLPTSLAAGDYVQIRSTTIFSGIGNTGEVIRVKSISGSGPYTITLYGQLEEPYLTAASAGIERLNLVTGNIITGIKFRQTAQNRDTNGLVSLILTRGDLIENCELRDGDGPGLEIESCIDGTIDRCTFDNLTDDVANSRFGYGINIVDNCRNWIVSRSRFRYCRHGFTTNAAGTNGVPRHITVVDCEGSEGSSTLFDTHPEGKYVQFVNCTAHHTNAMGFSMRAPWSSIVNPTVTGVPNPERAIYFKVGANNGRVIQGRLAQYAGATESIRIEANNCTVDGTEIENINASSLSAAIRVSGTSSVIRGVRIRGAVYSTAFIVYETGSGTDHIIDGGVYATNSGRYLTNAVAGVTVRILSPPLRDSDSLINWAVNNGAGTVVGIGTFTTGTKPPAANYPTGIPIHVTDGGAGNVIQVSTGAAWVSLG